MGGSGSVSRIHFLDGICICSCICCCVEGVLCPEAGAYFLSTDEPDVCVAGVWHIKMGNALMAGCDVCAPVGETQARGTSPWHKAGPGLRNGR